MKGKKLTEHQKIDLVLAFRSFWKSIKPIVMQKNRPYHYETLVLKEMLDNIKEFDVWFMVKNKGDD